MWPLPAPNTPAPPLYDSVSDRRQPATTARLIAARPQVIAAYDAYSGHSGDVTGLAPLGLSAQVRADLRSNYKRFIETHGELYAAIKLGARWCPYCGERPVSGLDHYLPNSAFPEFSVLPVNLVPACHDCNKTKDVNYVDGSGEPLFLHAYFDDLADHQCVRATVDTSSGTALLTFHVDCPEAVSKPLAARARRHFASLGLDGLYRDKAEQEASVRAIEVRWLLEASVSTVGVAEHLIRSARAAGRVYGPNHWRPVALGALANDDDFCGGRCSPSIRY